MARGKNQAKKRKGGMGAKPAGMNEGRRVRPEAVEADRAVRSAGGKLDEAAVKSRGLAGKGGRAIGAKRAAPGRRARKSDI